MSGLGNSSDKCSKIVLTPSLLMRLFEWCHEDAANDVAMHKVFEKIISFTDGVNPLNMDVYEAIIANANDGQEKDSEECNYDCQTADGEPQVNSDLCDRLENAVASYHEGGIDGNCCYNAIQDAFADNVQCDSCCGQEPIDYTAIDTYCQPFGMGNYDGKPTTITLDCVKDELPCEECPEECIPAEAEDEIIKVIQLANG